MKRTDEQIKRDYLLDADSKRALFSGYFGVVPENMAIPSVLFLSETEAKEYANGATVRKYVMDLV